MANCRFHGLRALEKEANQFEASAQIRRGDGVNGAYCLYAKAETMYLHSVLLINRLTRDLSK
jgi:hypothetical protein